LKANNRSYLPVEQHYHFDGINTIVPTTMLGTGSSRELKNVEIYKGEISKRYGYTQLGGALDSAIIGIVSYTDDAGVEYVVASTLKYQYRYNSGTDAWVNITARPQSGTQAVTINTSPNTISWNPSPTGDETSEYPVGGSFLMSGATEGSHNTTHPITVTAYNSGSNLMTVTTSFDFTNAAGSPVVQGMVPLTGDEDDTFDWAVGTDASDGTVLFLTNGKDKVRRFKGGVAVTDLVDIPTFTLGGNVVTRAKTVAVYSGSLVLGNYTDNALRPKNVAWSDSNDLDDFANGNAGSNLLTDSRGDIQYITNLADRLAIYSSDSIAVQTFIGGVGIFSFEKVVDDTRLLGPRTVANLGPYHMFASEENIYLFDGTRQIRAAGDKISRRYREQVDRDNGTKSFAYHDKARQLVYFCIYKSGHTVENKQHIIWRLEYDFYNSGGFNWTREAYTVRPRSMGLFSRPSTIKWNTSSIDLVDWDDFGGSWTEGARRAGYPLRTTGGATEVYVHDDTSYTDDGTAVTSYWESKDFSSQVTKDYTSIISRWEEIEIELKGTQVDVTYSVDKGQSYHTAASAQTLTGPMQLYRFPIDKSGRTLRVRIENNEAKGTFTMGGILRVWYRPGGAY